MKKLLISIITVGLLSACNGGSNELQGKYVRAEGESKICDEYMDFKDKDTFEVQTTKKVSGYIATGTYEAIEDKENEYKFNYDDGGSDIYTLKFDEDGNLTATQSGHDACTFVKDEE